MSLGDLAPNNMNSGIQHHEKVNQKVETDKKEIHPKENKGVIATKKSNDSALSALHIDKVTDKKLYIHDCHQYSPPLQEKKQEEAFTKVPSTAIKTLKDELKKQISEQIDDSTLIHLVGLMDEGLKSEFLNDDGNLKEGAKEHIFEKFGSELKEVYLEWKNRIDKPGERVKFGNFMEEKIQKMTGESVQHKENSDQITWETPIFFIGAVAHSNLQYQGDQGKNLDNRSETYQHEMTTISNKILVVNDKGFPVLDENKNQQFVTIKGMPNEIHVYGDRLKEAYKEWEAQLSIPNAEPRFDTFVQKKMSTSKVFFKFAMENNVRYLSNQELEQTKVSFDKDGVVRQKSLDSKINDPVVMDNSDSYAFVIGKSGQQGNTSSLYMTEKKHGDKGIINHSSFFRGGKVKATGMISTQEGKIVQVVNLSGHYKPTDVEMAATFKFLKTKMRDEDFNKIVYVSTDNKKQLAGSFLASYELNHPELQNDLSEDKPIQQPLSLEPLKQSTAVSKEPVSFQKFSREVQMRADAFAMKKLISGLEAEKSDASYELQKLTVSQNPVAKVGGPLFVPKITLKSPEANANNHTQALSKAMAQARLMKADGNAASLEMLMSPLKKYSGSNKNSPEAVALAKELVTQCRLIKDKIKNADRRSPLKKENEAIKNLDEIIKSMGAFIDLEPAENMKTFYNKDELVSQLQLNQNFTESLEDKGKVADVIRIVKAETGTFITLSDNLKNILDQNSIKLSNLNEYASTVEFIKANSANEIKAADVIKNAVKVLGIQESTFAFKTGSENVKELLAGKLTSALSLATFLAPKEEHKMENASLSGQINPRGIASRFLDDSTNFSTSEWEAVLQAEHELAVAEFHLSENPQDKNYQEKVLSLSTKLAENKRALREKEFESTLPASFASLLQLKKATADLDNAKQALKKSPNDQKLSDEVVLKEQNLGGAKKKYNIEVSTLKDGFKGLSGVKEHVLTDLLFCAYDSHAGQYMVKNGSAFNIDFARFLAPCEVFERNGNLYPTLRTGLFDHPSSGEPLSANEIQKIQSWNIESIESQWKSEGLIGSSEAFKEADKKITEYFDDLDKASSVNYNIKDLCLKYDVKSENIQEGVLKKIVTDKIKQEMEGVREECFSQVHPEAFAAFKERVSGLQTYIKQCESENTPPTLKGAFPLMYPNMALFMKVMERLEVNPGSGISFAIKDGTMIQRSLTSIINDAKKANLVSEDEIKEMQSAIESYQKIDARKTSLQTTMSLR